MKNAVLIPLLLLVIFMVVLVTGCTSPAVEDQAKKACIDACKVAKAMEIDLSDGPCLSNEIQEDWVCDVAHSPRQDVDNIPENQCDAYGKTAHHFVEVDPDCGFIRSL